MRFTVQYPIAVSDCTRDLLGAEGMTRFAAAAEHAGFAALAFTEHPIPSEKWIRRGGHEAFDLTTGLGFCAAVTRRIRLMPYAMILPYRNPFMAAKAIATLDVLSDGRVTLVAGVGYLRSEFAAVGSEFDERNELFDEAVEVMRGIWSTRGFAFDGRQFTSLAQTALPPPPQGDDLPIWIAGNSRRARERAARVGQGWAPLLIDHDKAATIRTAALPSLDALAAAVADLRERCESAGRDPRSLDIQLESAETNVLIHGHSLERHAEFLAQLADIGVNWFVVNTPAASTGEALEALARYGEEVISPIESGRGRLVR